MASRQTGRQVSRQAGRLYIQTVGSVRWLVLVTTL